MLFTTLAIFITAASTVTAYAPEAYGAHRFSAPVHTFETRKAKPTKAAVEKDPETKVAYHSQIYSLEAPRATETHHKSAYHSQIYSLEAPRATETHQKAAYHSQIYSLEAPRATETHHKAAHHSQIYSLEAPRATETHHKSAYHSQIYSLEAPRATQSSHKDPEHHGEEHNEGGAFAKPTKSVVEKDPFHPSSAPTKALPTKVAEKIEPKKEDPPAVCAKGSEISCCTTDSSGSAFLGNVLGGSCTLQNLLLVSSLNSNCAAANTFCCPTTQHGTLNINLSCIPITL